MGFFNGRGLSQRAQLRIPPKRAFIFSCFDIRNAGFPAVIVRFFLFARSCDLGLNPSFRYSESHYACQSLSGEIGIVGTPQP